VKSFPLHYEINAFLMINQVKWDCPEWSATQLPEPSDGLACLKQARRLSKLTANISEQDPLLTRPLFDELIFL
jgi:hypothetical protein